MKTLVLVLVFSLVSVTAAVRSLPPLPPAPVKRVTTTPERALARQRALARVKSHLRPREAATRSVRMVCPLRFKATPEHRVFFGELPRRRSPRTLINDPAPLHTEIYYQNDVVTYYPDGEPAIADVVTVTVRQPADCGAVLEYSSDFKNWSMAANWGPYPAAQPVSITWIRSNETVEMFYPVLFFRAYQY